MPKHLRFLDLSQTSTRRSWTPGNEEIQITDKIKYIAVAAFNTKGEEVEDPLLGVTLTIQYKAPSAANTIVKKPGHFYSYPMKHHKDRSMKYYSFQTDKSAKEYIFNEIGVCLEVVALPCSSLGAHNSFGALKLLREPPAGEYTIVAEGKDHTKSEPVKSEPVKITVVPGDVHQIVAEWVDSPPKKLQQLGMALPKIRLLAKDTEGSTVLWQDTPRVTCTVTMVEPEDKHAPDNFTGRVSDRKKTADRTALELTLILDLDASVRELQHVVKLDFNFTVPMGGGRTEQMVTDRLAARFNMGSAKFVEIVNFEQVHQCHAARIAPCS